MTSLNKRINEIEKLLEIKLTPEQEEKIYAILDEIADEAFQIGYDSAVTDYGE